MNASWVLPVLIGVAAVLTLGALAAFVSWGSREGEGTETVEKASRLRIEPGKTNRWLIVTLVVLLVAIAAGAAWFLLSSPVPSDVQALLDDYIAAWNAHDGDAVLATIGTGIHMSDGGTFNGARLASYVNSMPTGWAVTQTGKPLVLERPFVDATRYLIVVPSSITVFGGSDSTTSGVSMYRIVRSADGESILNHEWINQ